MACLTESGIRRNDLTAGLRRIGLERQFRAFGLNGKISWLVREPVADKVVSRLDYEGGRISGLVLAGACKQRTIIFGVYGIPAPLRIISRQAVKLPSGRNSGP